MRMPRKMSGRANNVIEEFVIAKNTAMVVFDSAIHLQPIMGLLFWPVLKFAGITSVAISLTSRCSVHKRSEDLTSFLFTLSQR